MSKTRKNTKNASMPSVYNMDHYTSNDGMLTTVWGPGMWHYLHTISFNYPVHPTRQDKYHYRDFILSLKYTLPCGKCRTNLEQNFKKLPLRMKHMKNRATFSRYIYDLHELINTMLGKTSGLTYDVIRDRYEHFRARCTASLQRKTAKKRGSISSRAKTENGCTDPLYGEKSKCVIHIVPDTGSIDSMLIDKKCIKKRLTDDSVNSS